MVKKKLNMSLFSTCVQQINNNSSSSSTTEYHLIDNEYYVAFNTLDDIQRFHNKLIEKQQNPNNEKDNDLQTEQDDNEMDMKTFAQQFLIDLPETIINHNKNPTEIHINQSKNSNNSELNTKRQRRNIKDLPQSSNFLFMSDDDNGNIFDSLTEKKSSSRTNRIAYEDMSSILLTLDVKKPKKKKSLSKIKNQEPTIAIELAEPSIIKNEPIEQQEQLVITHVTETKEEPIQINVIPTGPMSFGTNEYSHDLDNYVQNIHRSCTTNVPISNSSTLRPQRIRKRKKFYIEESETNIKPKRIRKKRLHTNINTTLLTDAEIEQQFGERLSPTIKFEHHDEIQHNINNHIIIETQSIPETPIEKARAKLMNALGRGHGPDTFLLKIRSRENKIFEVELAIYSTADWHSYRSKILSKIEEALRGLRVSWTKIDIRVDHFDIQICTSSQSTSMTSSSSLTNMNSSWFLKVLSESGPLIVHIHDRRHPQQRHFIKCSCPQCSSNEQINDSSLPVIVSVSPAKTTYNRHLSTPTILRKTHLSLSSTISSLHNIHTKFFQDLIYQYGTNTISSVTQCILDLTLIVSVHSSLSCLYTSNEDYEKNYQQIIDPLKYTMNQNENKTVSKCLNQPDILTFYQNIKKNKANIRNAQSMKGLIFNNISRTSSITSNIIKTTELILPKQPSTNRRSLIMNRFNKRHRSQISNNYNYNGIKQQAHFTPIIELKPILGGSPLTDECDNDEPIRKVTKIISTNTIQKDSRRINTVTTQEFTPRVIRLSINKSPSLPSNSIRLVASTSSHPIASVNKIETSPLVPKQINIIKQLSSSITPAIKLANPILISNKSLQQPSIN
ncbi:unnamed protein product [Rotaria sordida]|uniref:Uncharacterized protein n=2 Tax=Rotaria sordida TaxID=392033 RepID=A0A818R2L6_9BILA|nr:unnamed protein product [Rotaria sordida]